MIFANITIYTYYKFKMFEKIKSILRIAPKSKGITWEDSERPGYYNGALPFGHCNNMSYDNSFPDIVRIAESFAEVMPYAVDEKGKRLSKQPQIVKALYNPNSEMSVSDFLETLITMLLVHPLVHILVWHYEDGKAVPGGPFTPDNVAGFTFLENAFVSRVGGKTLFQVRDHTWTRDDVITLSLNVNPYQIMMGYSPTQAVKKWATVDDYIAEYQAAQFGNGGVPAGLMTVTAPSVEAYNQAVDKIIAAHTGPSNANRVIYTHRPTSTIDGKPMAAGVEWTPFAQSNKEMTLDALFNQANKKIDMTFGVPEEIKGYLQNSNYASAEVADYVFARRILYPKLVKVYSKFTHEMNRITGGTGFAFSFDFELPVLNDARKVQVETLTEMLDAGFTVESAVEALRLPRSFLKLEKTTDNSDENLQVEDTVSDKPSQAEVSKSVHVHNCEHHHDKNEGNYEGIVNPTLKSLIQVYVALLSNKVSTKLNNGDSLEEAINSTKVELNNDDDVSKIITLITACVYYQLALNEIENAKKFGARLGGNGDFSALSDEDLTSFNMEVQSAAAMAKTLIESNESLRPVSLGNIQTTINKITAVLDEYGVHAAISDFAGDGGYNEQLVYMLKNFGDYHLNDWEEFGKGMGVSTADEAIAAIQTVIIDKAWENTRWALTEQHRGEELGKLLAAEEAGEWADLEPYKTWEILPDACGRCVALNGETVRADKTFSNGNMVPADHPNCRCSYSVEFLSKEKSVKVTCPSCKRYMFESNGGKIENVICANSKCKKHFDIEVKNGKVKAVERSQG